MVYNLEFIKNINFYSKILNKRNFEINPNERIALDKDLKGSSKLYSLETCCFVSQSTNSIERLVRKGNPTNKHSVKAINCLTNEIKVFYSVSEASREMGVDRTHITACCKGRQKTAGGYKWSYIN